MKGKKRLDSNSDWCVYDGNKQQTEILKIPMSWRRKMRKNPKNEVTRYFLVAHTTNNACTLSIMTFLTEQESF